MGKKTISNSFTVNVVDDGKSAPYYFQEWFAWSANDSTQSVNDPPSDVTTWSESVPARVSGKPYLWKKYIKYTYNSETGAYTAGATQYVRINGSDGTSIDIKDEVLNVIPAGGTKPSGTKTGDLCIEHGNQRLWVYNGSTWSQSGTPCDDGDSYVNRYDGHLWMWSDEKNQGTGDGWIDLGQFQGRSGETWYTHIAWAREVTLSEDELEPVVEGDYKQMNIPNVDSASDVTGFVIVPEGENLAWMGYLIDNDPEDGEAGDANLYTWSYLQGTSPYVLSIDNQNEPFACTKEGMLVEESRYVSRMFLFHGEKGAHVRKVRLIYGEESEREYIDDDDDDNPWTDEDGVTYFVAILEPPHRPGLPSYKRGVINITFPQGYDLSANKQYTVKVWYEDPTNTIYEDAYLTGTLTVTGIRAGEDGSPAVVYRLVPSTLTVVKKKNGTYEPTSVTCKVTKTEGAVTVDASGGFTLQQSLTGGSSWSPYTHPITSSTIGAAGLMFKVSVTQDGQTVVHDTQTVTLLEDGADGESPWIADLTNEMDAMICDVNGFPNAGQVVSTTVFLYHGATKKPFTIGVFKNAACTMPYPSNGADGGLVFSWSTTEGTERTITIGSATEPVNRAAIDEVTEIYIKLTSTEDNTITRILDFTLNGARGTAVYRLSPTPSAVKFTWNGSDYAPSPQSINVVVMRSEKNGTETEELTVNGQTANTYVRYSTSSMPTSYNRSGDSDFPKNGLSVPKTAEYSYVYIAIFEKNTTVHRLLDKESIPILWDGEDGQPGTAGSNTATVYLFKRFAEGSVPAATGITGNSVYTFATGAIVAASGGSLNGWQRTVPGYEAGKPDIYVTAATAYSATGAATATIAQNSWATPVKYGGDGTSGINTAALLLYKRTSASWSTANPQEPTVELIYKFADGKYYYNNAEATSAQMGGWTRNVPNGTEPCYVIQATALSSGESDEIGTSEWSDPVQFVKNGDTGEPAIVADLSNEMTSFGTDSDGKVLGSQNIVLTSTVKMFYGLEEQTITSVGSKGSTFVLQWKGSGNAVNSTVADYAVSGLNSKTATITITIKPYSQSGTLITDDMILYARPACTIGGSAKTRDVRIMVNHVSSGVPGQSPTIYELLPNPSVVSVSRDSNNLLTPENVPVKCGYTATTGNIITSNEDANSSVWIGDKYLVYYRRNTRGSSWESSWKRYSASSYYTDITTPGLAVRTYDKVEFILYDVSGYVSAPDTIVSPTASRIADRETVPVVAEGSKGAQGNSPDVYEVKTTIDSVLIPSNSNTASAKFNAGFFRNSSPYNCYYGLYARKGNVYTHIQHNNTGSQVSSLDKTSGVNVSVTAVDGYYNCDALVIFMVPMPVSDGNYAPSTYIAKKEIQVLKSGDDGVSYSIVVERAVLKYNTGTGVLGCDITCYGIMNQGGTITRLSPYDYSVYGKLDVEDDWIGFDDDYSANTFDDGGYWDEWSGSTAPACMMLSLRTGNSELATTSVAVSVVMPGHIGRFYEYAGVWKDEVTQITNTENHGWYVKYGNNFYMLITDDNVTVYCNNYSTPPDQDTERYELMTGDRQYYMAKAFFGEYAQFGGMIINGDYEFSRYGYMKGYGGTRTEITSGEFYTNADPDDMFGIGDMYIQGDPAMLMYGKNYNWPWSGTTAWESVNSTSGTIAAGWYTLEITGYTTTGIMSWQVQGGQISKTNLNTPTGNITYNSSDTTPPYDNGATSVVNFYYPGTGSITLQVKASSPLATMIVTNYYMRKCKFIPKFILNMMTGESSQEDVTVRGRLLDGVSEITPTNYNRFIFHSEDIKANRLDPTAMGTTVRFTGTFTNPPIIHFPGFAGETAETKDRIRAMKGKTITIINATSSVIGLTGGTGWMPMYAQGSAAQTVTLDAGGIALVDCVYGLSEMWSQQTSFGTTKAKVQYGNEQVIWRYRFVGSTQSFNEDYIVAPWWTNQQTTGELEGHSSNEINS